MIALVTADLSRQPVDDIDRPPLEAAFAGRAFGRFSHAFVKGPILDVGGRFVSGEYTEVVDAVTPAPDWVDAAERVLARYRELSSAWTPAPEPLLYSRVDLVAGDGGEPRVLEVELVEPSFFFSTAPGAADRFVDAVLERLA